jgi:transcriptional regulator with XRE-family HTH domain
MARPAPIERRVATRIRELRERQNLSQGALAKLAGTSRSQVVALESGARAPTIATLEVFARILGVALPDLVSTTEVSSGKQNPPDRAMRVALLLRDRGPDYVEAVERVIAAMDKLVQGTTRRLGRRKP